MVAAPNAGTQGHGPYPARNGGLEALFFSVRVPTASPKWAEPAVAPRDWAPPPLSIAMPDTPTPPTAVALDNDGTDRDTPPELPFLHMWTDLDGTSRVNASQMRGFGLKSISGDADPQWLRPFPGEVSQVLFAVLPVGWVGEWHESPAPQWVIPLRGRWFLETGDGTRVEMGPGDIHFGQDLDTEIDKPGHLSGTVGDEPCHMMIVQYAQSPGAKTEHPF